MRRRIIEEMVAIMRILRISWRRHRRAGFVRGWKLRGTLVIHLYEPKIEVRTDVVILRKYY